MVKSVSVFRRMDYDLSLKAISRFWLFGLICLIVVGCEAEPTPVAMVVVPTNTSDAVTEAAPDVTATVVPLNIGIVEPTLNFGKGLAALQALGTLSPVDETTDTAAFDILASYGLIDGWEQSPISHHVMLLLNTDLEPLNDPEILAIVQQSIDTRALVNNLPLSGLRPNTAITTASPVEQRTQLANIGFPDGLFLTLAAASSFGQDIFIAQLNQNAIELALLPADVEAIESFLDNNTAHLVFFVATDAERDSLMSTYGAALLDLFAVPISYVSRLETPITFTDAGWPIPND